MEYIACFYNKKDGRYFRRIYLYYTKKEIREKAKREFPNCSILYIKRSMGLCY